MADPTAHTVWAFDPGHVTGFAQGWYNKNTPLEIQRTVAVTENEFVPFIKQLVTSMGVDEQTQIVSEKWLARTNNQFVADDTPKKIEGMLEAVFGPRVIYRPRTKKEQVPDRVLKRNGLWQTGKSVDWTDGRDVNDALIHMLGFVAFDLRHLPTLRKYFKSGKD